MIQRGVLNVTIMYTVSKTSAISSCATDNALLPKLGVSSKQLFMGATGDVAPLLEKI